MERFRDDLLKWDDIHASIMEYHDGLVVSLFLTAEDCRNARFAVEGALNALEDIRAVDAVEVVRCRDCNHWKPSGSKAGNSFSDMEYIGGCEFTNYCRRESDYCSYGERKE